MERLLLQTRRHDISFNRNGLIRLSARIVRALDISSGDSLNIICDQREFLLCAIKHDNSFGKYEASCYRTNKSGRAMCARSTLLCRLLLDTLGISDQYAAFVVGRPTYAPDGTPCLPIITLRPILKQK